MKKLLFVALMFITLSTQAQNAVLDKNGNYYSVEISGKTPEPTGKTFTDTKNKIVYPIYITDKGKLFIIKKSKKTNKEYRSYLKLVK